MNDKIRCKWSYRDVERGESSEIPRVKLESMVWAMSLVLLESKTAVLESQETI